MRLTQVQREAFVRAVMDDVPSVNYGEQARALAREAIARAMPQKIEEAFRDPKCEPWLNKAWLNLPYPFGIQHEYLPGSIIDFNLQKQEPEVWKKLEELAKLEQRQQKARDELRAKLQACAGAATTRKALAGLLPEFEKYLPQEREPCKTLPVVANVVADFINAGWPKQQEPKQRRKSSQAIQQEAEAIA